MADMPEEASPDWEYRERDFASEEADNIELRKRIAEKDAEIERLTDLCADALRESAEQGAEIERLRACIDRGTKEAKTYTEDDRWSGHYRLAAASILAALDKEQANG